MEVSAEDEDAKEVMDTAEPLPSVAEEDVPSDQEGVGMNPQDATLHPVSNDFSVMVHNDNSDPLTSSTKEKEGGEENEEVVSVMKNGTTAPSKKRRVRKRARTAAIAIQKSTTFAPSLPHPSNQYECLLVRRAILPAIPYQRSPANANSDRRSEDDSVYGDTALGLKLSIADTGQVIVQNVTPLADGRASPAQLTGVIRRGDILLAIDGVSLTENALAGLKPLQAPDDPAVPCRRQYHLRLAAGAGLEILESMEAQTKREDGTTATDSVLGIFPMVDQLSGMPLFEEETHKGSSSFPVRSEVSPTEVQETKEPAADLSSIPKTATRLDVHISEHLARQRSLDRYRFLMTLDQEHPSHRKNNEILSIPLSPPERQELGRKAVLGAFNVLRQVEQVDAGSDIRSFHSWNTTLSLYSRASARRRRVFDAASLPSKNFGKVIEEEADEKENDDDNQSASSEKQSNADSEGIDGDELLLRLAAHDEIWRRQVVEFLDNSRKEIESPATTTAEEKDADPEAIDINAALSKELGNFLFGENMSKILTKHKTPRSLPSEEVTAVLFDLATKLSTAIPDEIKASGSLFSSKSQLAPFKEFKHYSTNIDVHLASQFLLESALPAWLKSFRPLAWEHRRILWPVDTVLPGGSMASSLSDDDGITVDTTNISLYSTISRHHRRKKSIQEIIEDQELDIETRGEACFLVTFYFVHGLLPKLMISQDKEGSVSILGDILTYLRDYGSYLRMDTCLVYSSALKATSVIDMLLSIAKHDPRHREAIKQMTKSGAMVFYEPTMLSAVLQLLENIRQDTSTARKQVVLDFCVSAYPDIQPWQVERASEGAPDIYYSYLCLLLHPIDGHDSARRDAKLVQIWCEFSVKEIVFNSADDSSIFRSNFLAVASRTSSYHLVYHRDLPFLVIKSIEIKEFCLALDLIAEIVEDPNISNESSNMDLVVRQMRLLASISLGESQGGFAQMLRRIVRLYSKSSFQKIVDVPSELLQLIRHRGRDSSASLTSSPAVLELIEFLTKEAIAGDVLHALFVGMNVADPKFEPEMVSIIQKLLVRGASLGFELSSSLYRIRQAKKRLEEESELNAVSTTGLDRALGIWARMAGGTLAMGK